MNTQRRRTHKSSICAAFVFAALLVNSFAAPPDTVRYERRSIFPWDGGFIFSHGGTAHWGSNPDFGWQSFSAITFSSPEILTGMRWTGSYYDYVDVGNNPVSPNTIEWTVSIHEDEEGQPSKEPLFTESHDPKEVSVRELGVVPKNRGAYHLRDSEFELSFTEPFKIDSEKRYWISIFSLGETYNPVFALAVGVADRSEARRPLDPQAPPERLELLSYTIATLENDNEGGDSTGPRAITLIGHPVNDADEDGMEDTWETANGLDPALADHAADPDEDGATNLQEFERHSDPQNPDTDGDGLLDGVESNSGTFIDSTDTGTSPTLADTDRDGLTDNLEIPGAVPSSDGSFSLSSPNTSDTDRDSYGDYIEHVTGYDPVSAESSPAPIVLGTGTEALLGGDLTDPENDGNPEELTGYNVTIENGNDEEKPDDIEDLVDNLLGETSDDWCCADRGETARAFFEFDEPVVITHFTIASGSSTSRTYDPRHWAIRGSNDGGETWVNIYTRLNYEEAVWTDKLQVLRYNAGEHFQMPQAFRTIRFHSKGSNRESGRNFRLGELELFGFPHRTEITHVERDRDGNVRLEWSSVSNSLYAVDSSPDLQSWTELEDGIESSGEQTEYTSNDAKQGALRSGYYRVRLQDW